MDTAGGRKSSEGVKGSQRGRVRSGCVGAAEGVIGPPGLNTHRDGTGTARYAIGGGCPVI
jgi:hypothetical protein